MEALLSNQFVVLALDALLHLASIFVLGVVVILACKLLSKGFVDAKLLTGLAIAALLVVMRVFLLNNIHHVLAGVDVIVTMAALGFILFLTALILTYKLVSIPVLGSAFSALAIVAAQLAIAHYTPILSLRLMPEGQRFAEYAGVSNERTQQLMAQAESLQGNSRNSIGRVLKEALASIAFLSSEEEKKTLSKDMASGLQFIQERRAYTESLSEEELADYRASMGAFMEEQGIDLGNRYSLDNLKNATPEDLDNLASFMSDMNEVYGFADGQAQGMGEGDDLPPTLDSLKQIAQNLKGVKIGDRNSEQFADLLKNMLGDEDFEAEMAKVRGQVTDLKNHSGQLMAAIPDNGLEGMRRGLESQSGGPTASKSGLNQFGLSRIGSTENLANQPLPYSPADTKNNEVDYYLPVNTYSDFPEELPKADNPRKKAKSPEPEKPVEEVSDHFPASALTNSLTEDYVLRAPKGGEERTRWLKAAQTIQIGAWFEGSGGANQGTVFIDGAAYRSNDIIERKHEGDRYLFRFEGVREGQIVITSLKRESNQANGRPDQSDDDL